MSGIYDRISAAVTRRRGASLIAAVVQEGTPVLLAVDKLVAHLEGRGIPLAHARIDTDGDIGELLAEAVASDSGVASAVLVHGFEAVPASELEEFLRRANFARARLAKTPVAALLVVESATWSWMVREVPDLVRWADGPFLLPPIENPPHPLKGVELAHLRFGRPIPDLLARSFDTERGLDLFSTSLAAIQRGRAVVVGGPPGVGRSHLAVRLERRLHETRMSTVWPPNAHVVNGRPLVADRALVPDAEVPSPKQFLFGQPYREWFEAQAADVVLVKHPAFQQDALAKFREAPRRGVVVSTTSNALAEESANLLPVYVPPVRVELGDDGAEIEPNEPGIELLANGLHDRARLIGTDLGEVLRAETLRFLVVASGGIPAILWLSASETSRRAALAGLLPAPLDLARVVALDAARNWQLRFEQAGSRPDATTRRRTRRALRAREEDAGRLQVLIIDKRIVRRRHPLVRIAEGRALRS